MKDTNFFKYYSRILRPDRDFFIISIIYGVVVSVLSLAVPISIQALVNTIAFGVLAQPLVVISILLFGLLTLSSVLKALQIYVIELFQRRFYIRVTSDTAENLILTSNDFLHRKGGPELVNRYFDIMTVQKKMTTILTGGFSLLLQLVLGLLLLAFYHPYFLIFDAILISLLIFLWVAFGKKAMGTAVVESSAKYQTAAWLEDLANGHHALTSHSDSRAFSRKKSNAVIEKYIVARTKHFKVLFMQVVVLLIIYAFLSALILGLGGFLVISEQLSLGQLVAAELIVTVILTGLAGAGKYLEDFYDLYAAMSKIYDLYCIDKSGDASDESILASAGSPFLSRKKFLSQVDQLEAGKVYGVNEITNLRGLSFSGKLFRGSILENIWCLDRKVDEVKVQETLALLEVDDKVSALDRSINTLINSFGYPLDEKESYLLLLARKLLNQQKVVFLEKEVMHVEPKILNKAIKKLKSEGRIVLLLTPVKLDEIKIDEFIDIDWEGLL